MLVAGFLTLVRSDARRQRPVLVTAPRRGAGDNAPAFGAGPPLALLACGIALAMLPGR